MVTKEEVFANLTIKQDAGVPFNRTNAVPLDKHSIFASKVDAVSYATLSATAYPGQVIAVQETEDAPFSAELSTSEGVTSLTSLPSYEIAFNTDRSKWEIEFSNGYAGEITELYNGSYWLTSPSFSSSDLSIRFKTDAGNLTIPQDTSLTGTDYQALVTLTRLSATVDTWNLYVLDPSAPNNLKKIEGGSSSGGGGSSGDVQAEEARAKAAENALSGAIDAINAKELQNGDGIDILTADHTVNVKCGNGLAINGTTKDVELNVLSILGGNSIDA